MAALTGIPRKRRQRSAGIARGLAEIALGLTQGFAAGRERKRQREEEALLNAAKAAEKSRQLRRQDETDRRQEARAHRGQVRFENQQKDRAVAQREKPVKNLITLAKQADLQRRTKQEEQFSRNREARAQANFEKPPSPKTASQRDRLIDKLASQPPTSFPVQADMLQLGLSGLDPNAPETKAKFLSMLRKSPEVTDIPGSDGLFGFGRTEDSQEVDPGLGLSSSLTNDQEIISAYWNHALRYFEFYFGPGVPRPTAGAQIIAVPQEAGSGDILNLPE